MSFTRPLVSRYPASRHRVLAAAIVVALSAVSGSLAARDLVGGTAVVNPGDAAESWRISAGANLLLNPGSVASGVFAEDSIVEFNGASATATPDGATILSLGNSNVQIANSTVIGGVVFQRNTVATITGSAFNSSSSDATLFFINASGNIVDSSVNSSSAQLWRWARWLARRQQRNPVLLQSTVTWLAWESGQ